MKKEVSILVIVSIVAVVAMFTIIKTASTHDYSEEAFALSQADSFGMAIGDGVCDPGENPSTDPACRCVATDGTNGDNIYLSGKASGILKGSTTYRKDQWDFCHPCASGMSCGCPGGAATCATPYVAEFYCQSDGYMNWKSVKCSTTCTNGGCVVGDVDNDGYNNNAECNDLDANINPAKTEICGNSIDENCDGITTCTTSPMPIINKTSCISKIEICGNGKDDNCNGQIDENKRLYFRDADADGYGIKSLFISACTAPSGYITTGGDCNDNSKSINPKALEICGNTIDENCDGVKAACGGSGKILQQI